MVIAQKPFGALPYNFPAFVFPGLQGILSFAKKYGAARVDDACAAALELEAYDYRFVRRYLEHHSQPPLSLRQVDPLIRQLNLYRPWRR